MSDLVFYTFLSHARLAADGGDHCCE